MMSADPSATAFPHRWTSTGVTAEAPFTGAHLLHLSIAGCVLNDVHREAAALGMPVDGVRVSTEGGFDPQAWTSTGITYVVDIDSTAEAADIARLLDRVDAVAEIPRAIRSGARVERSR